MADSSSKLSSLGLIGGQAVFIIIFCIVLIAVADKSDVRTDWSLSADYSLHPATERLCNEINIDIHIYALWPKKSSKVYGNLLRNHKNIERKLEIIAKSNNHIQYTYLDPDLDKPQLKALAEQYGELKAPAIYVANDDKKIIRIPYTYAIAETLENNIGSALLALQSGADTKIYLLAGHGELRIGGGDDDGIDFLTRLLITNGYTLVTLDPNKLDKLQRIPKDGVLFIAGATSALGKECITAVREFMQDGGNTFILADHRSPVDLCTLLRQRGVLVSKGFPAIDFSAAAFKEDAPVYQAQILCSAEQSLVGSEGRLDRLQLDPSHIYYDREKNPHFLVPQNHPCTSRSHYSGRFLQSPYTAYCLPIDPERPGLGEIMKELGTAPYRIDHVISIYGNNVWPAQEKNTKLLRNTNADKAPRDYPLACTVEYALGQDSVVKDARSRMVLWASRQAASNLLLKQGTLANELFILDSLAWLDFRENSSSIPPSTFNSFKVECSDGTLQTVMILLVIVIPMLSLGGAILTWWD
ncbi:MAG: Gldg family protein, partial [Planctomycetes bacterium]|nr:Gldg family protein [Planctomycetota bacterium]